MNKKDVCKECRGWCCYRFCISLISTASQEPDWEAEHAREDAIHKDLDFMEKNFRKVGCRSIDNCDKMSFHFTCLKYDKVRGICTEYKKRRPYACIKFKCEWRQKGVVPRGKEYPWQAKHMRKEGLSLKKLLN